jgi:hypothetical protein
MAAVYPIAGGRFGGSDGESKGVEGTSQVNRISNLLIMLVTIAGFDPAIRRFESFHPSQNSSV